MRPERVLVRTVLSAMVIGIFAIGFIPAVILKALEGAKDGAQGAIETAREAVRQIWAAKGIKEFDNDSA